MEREGMERERGRERRTGSGDPDVAGKVFAHTELHLGGSTRLVDAVRKGEVSLDVFSFLGVRRKLGEQEQNSATHSLSQ